MYAFRDARPEDIAPILRLVHQGDVRGRDTPPLDEASLTDPRYRAAFDQINNDTNNRLIVGEQAGSFVATLQITMIPDLPRFGLKRAILENVFVDPVNAAMAWGPPWSDGRWPNAERQAVVWCN